MKKPYLNDEQMQERMATAVNANPDHYFPEDLERFLELDAEDIEYKRAVDFIGLLTKEEKSLMTIIDLRDEYANSSNILLSWNNEEGTLAKDVSFFQNTILLININLEGDHGIPSHEEEFPSLTIGAIKYIREFIHQVI